MTADQLLEAIAGHYVVLHRGVIFSGDSDLGQYFPPRDTKRELRAATINGVPVAKFAVQLPPGERFPLKAAIERAEYRVTANNSLFCDRLDAAADLFVTDEIHVGFHQQGTDAGKVKELVHRVEFFRAGQKVGDGGWICPMLRLPPPHP